jgi:RND family efflux transporter MFP subunit
MTYRILTIAVFASVLLAACTENPLEEKKKKLAEYKTEVKELNTKIGDLEKEIAKLDTSFHIEQKAKRIEVAPLEKQDFKHYIEVQGNVDAEENVTALPQQPGVVTAIYVKVGDRVTKGQVLGLTETTAAMEIAVQTIQTQLNLATTAYEKQKALWDQKIGSEIQFLQAQTQKEALEKQLAAQKNQLQMTKIVAPVSGTVDEVRLKVGDMAANSQLMPGIRIINNNKLKVKAKLADSDFGKVKQNDKVEIEFPDINKSITAPVTYVSQTIDPRSRTYGLEVNLANASGYAANMVAKLKINDASFKDVILVPTNTIQKSETGNYVLVAETKNGVKTAVKKNIEVGMSYNGRTVVTKGLEPGEQIITFGYSEVVDGQKIEF